MKITLLAFMTFLLVSCGGEVARLAPQEFDGNTYQIEARPGPTVLKGMNEFLVIVSNKHRQPVSDLIISLRVDDTKDWIQTIQDGQVGVYRRAIDVRDPQTDVLKVHIRKGSKELKILQFPFARLMAKPAG